MKLFVAGIPRDFDETDLKEMFQLYGSVVSAKLVMDKVTGKSKCFGFVEMSNRTEGQQTIDALHGAGMAGKKISVQEAEERNQGGSSGGYDRNNRGGGGGGGRYYR